MRFGHYTVFDTPAENKHTQVYVEYDVPNNDNLNGATGSIFLTEGGEGSGGGSDEGNGILSITISPELTLTPTLESIMPITDNDMDNTIIFSAGNTLDEGETFTVTVTPSSDCYAVIIDRDSNVTLSAERGAPASVSLTTTEDGTLPVQSVMAAPSTDDPETVASRNIVIQN